jgi:hypothetical protein
MTSGRCAAILAIELGTPSTAPLRLPTEQAAYLLDAIAIDLARLVPDAHELGLATAAALFDPAQVLRPGWPLFAELSRLYTQQRRGDPAPTLIAFGTAGGRMASEMLEPDVALVGGALLANPFVLVGDADTARRCAAHIERTFEAEGLAGAAVARFLAEALGVEVVHARYLTPHDLCALTAIQLEHAGMAAAWPLIEAALLSPERAEFLRAPAGQPWFYRDGEVRALALGFGAWARTLGTAVARERKLDAWCAWQQEQRAFAALLGAHALVPRWCAPESPRDDDAALLESLAQAVPLASPWLIEAIDSDTPATRPMLVAHRTPELGVAALSVLARDGDTWQAIAHAYPLAGDALRPLCAALAARYGTAAHPQDAGTLTLSADGATLGIPGGAMPPV